VEAIRWTLWAQTLASPLLLAGVLLLFRLASETHPYQLGLSGHRWAGNLVLGYGAWLLLTPLVNGVNLLAVLATRLTGREPVEHVLVRVMQSQGNPLDWAPAVLVAVVLAPLLEELLFRGILQPWLARRPWGGLAAAVAAFVLALPHAESQGLALPLFLIALTPGLFYAERLAWQWLPSPHVAPAIYGTSLLFAAVHGGVWPSPVPLFVLSLGLGYVAYRTQGLVAPIVMHALFNGVTVLTLLFPQGAADTKGKETTSADRRPAGVSTSSTVPGPWLPRRT
jgi:membrane protease YdiL (CAAX protease family)